MSNIKALGQYIKDLSFEIPNSPQVFLKPQDKPNIGLTINIDAQKINEELYEVSLKIIADATSNEERVFICEVAYAGIFSITDAEPSEIEKILLIDCSTLLFPFARRIIANNTIDSGFPPLMIDPVNFTDLFNRRDKAKTSPPVNDTTN